MRGGSYKTIEDVMRVAIDMLLAEQKPGGMLLATRAVLNGLALIDQKNEYYIITRRPEDYEDLLSIANLHIYPIKLRSWREMLVSNQFGAPGLNKPIQG